jgi:hypothetical protein
VEKLYLLIPDEASVAVIGLMLRPAERKFWMRKRVCPKCAHQLYPGLYDEEKTEEISKPYLFVLQI